jgi:hypothetical protein
VRFGSSDWLKLGVFYVTKAKNERGINSFEASDRMYKLDRHCSFNGGSFRPALVFPATMQQMLDYIVAELNSQPFSFIECEFVCQKFIVAEKPVFDETIQGDRKYYTYRELLSFIASAHGANVKFKPATDKMKIEKLEFSIITNPVETIFAADCISQSVDDYEGFTIKGIRLFVDDNEIFINQTGEPYNEDMAGILEIENPFGSIEIAEYLWKILGNFTYYSCSLERRGKGWVEAGDVVNFVTIDGSHTLPIIVQNLDYEIAYNGGFIEKITSTAETAMQSSNRLGSRSQKKLT